MMVLLRAIAQRVDRSITEPHVAWRFDGHMWDMSSFARNGLKFR